MLPAGSACVLAGRVGTATLGDGNGQPRVQVRAAPLSPAELRDLTASLAPDAQAASGLTQPAPLSWPDKPSLLVADDNDNEINRMVATALVESLGYSVRVARDGWPLLVSRS